MMKFDYTYCTELEIEDVPFIPYVVIDIDVSIDVTRGWAGDWFHPAELPEVCDMYATVSDTKTEVDLDRWLSPKAVDYIIGEALEEFLDRREDV